MTVKRRPDYSESLTKGELLVGSSSNRSEKLPAGTNGQTLVVDNTQDVGVKWETKYPIESTIVDTKGDLIVASGADSVSILPAGTNNHILMADSSQTLGLKYAALAASQIPALDSTKVSTVSINNQTTNYTLALSDAGKLITMGSASALTLTIPLESSVAFPTGTKIDIIRTGAGELTVGGSVTIVSESSKKRINAQNQAATLIKTGTDTWYLVGALKT